MKNEKLSELARARWADPETRAKIIAAMNSKTEEEKVVIGEKLRANALRRWSDEEVSTNLCAKMSDGQKANWADPVKKAARLAKRRATIARNKAKKEAENGQA